VLLAADTLLTGADLLRPGWIDVAGTTVRALGAGGPPGPADRTAAVVVPGFVDTHLHGGGGANFSAASAQETATAAALHRRRGTTTLIASLVTAAPAELLWQVRSLAADVRAGVLAGIHLEGPWLSVHRCGAHQPALMRDPDPAEIDRVLTAADGAIAMVTLAPERDGALAAIAQLTAAGVVAAVGHTEASYAQTRSAIEAGATVGTHLFNAMRPIDRREPGPVVALLEDARVSVELITDGVHIDPAIYRFVTQSVGAQRVSLITDAMAAPGCPTDATNWARWGSMWSAGWRASRAPTPSRAAPPPWTGCSGSPFGTADWRPMRHCCRRSPNPRSTRPVRSGSRRAS